MIEHQKEFIVENSLIYLQWDSYYGGLEKLSQLYEQIFSSYDPLVVILRPTKKGFYYKNDYVFEEKTKLLFILKYFLFTRKRKNSIFHIQYVGSLILLLTYLAGARKIVFHFHGTQFSHGYFDKMVWKLLEEKVVVVANSNHTEQIIRQKLNIKSKINHIPNLIKIHDFNFLERKLSGDKFIVTFAGRFDKGKNLDLIIKVSNVLKNIDSNIEFVFAGDGPEKVNIEKKIRDNQLESFVKLIPYTNDILKLYHQSHLFIFASLHESFGNVIAEAILSGLPVLCYQIPALEELINDDFFFFKEQNPELIAKKIIEIKGNYSNVNERLKNVYDYVKQNLNEEEIINKLNNIYQGFKN